MHKFKLSFLVSAALLAITPHAHAILNGIVPADGLVINPLNGQTLQAWKLAGRFIDPETGGNCSAVQIHAHWILAAGHCYRHDFLFANHLTTSPVGLAASCTPHPLYVYPTENGTKYDFALCRLSQPVGAGTTFPPLVSAPTELQPSHSKKSTLQDNSIRDTLRPYLAKWGYVMAYGYGGSSQGLAITDFGGLPAGVNPAQGYDPMLIPIGIGGDSGGAVYWLSPSSSEPALLGLMSNAGAPVRGTALLTEETLTWIRNTITAAGHSAPSTLTSSQHFSGPTGYAVQELPSPPLVRSINESRSNFTLSWSDPSNTAPIASYDITMGNGVGALSRTWSATFGQGNSTSILGTPTGSHTVCVRAKGASGSALAAYYGDIAHPAPPSWVDFFTPNCTTFDTNTPLPGAVGSITSTSTTLTTLTRRITFTWQEAAPQAATFKISQTLKYASGPARNSTIDTSGMSHIVTVSKGTQICITVKPFNALGMSGTQASTCVTAN